MNQIEWSRPSNQSRIEFCIDAFVEETAYVPAEARPVRDPSELSPQLERLAAAITAPNAWRAWVDGPRGWFVEGRLTEPCDASPDRPTVYLIFRDQDARAAAVGVWCRTAPGRWEPKQVFVGGPVFGAWH